MPTQLPDGRYFDEATNQVWNGTGWEPLPPVQAAPPPPPPPPAPIQAAPPQPTWNGTQWVFPAQGVPAAPVAPPPAPAFQSGLMPPAPAGAPPGTQPFPFIPQAPPPHQTSYAGPMPFGGGGQPAEISVDSLAWGSGHPKGEGFVGLIEDVEGGLTKAGQPNVTFHGKTLEPNGAVPAGHQFHHQFMLTVLEEKGKKPGIGKIFSVLKTLGFKTAPDPQFTEQFVKWLRDNFQSKTISYDAVDSKKSDLPDIRITGWYGSAPTPQATYTQPSGPVLAPAPLPPGPPPTQAVQQAVQATAPFPPQPPTGYGVSFGAPPNGASAFHNV